MVLNAYTGLLGLALLFAVASCFPKVPPWFLALAVILVVVALFVRAVGG